LPLGFTPVSTRFLFWVMGVTEFRLYGVDLRQFLYHFSEAEWN
jgi:hypothetical protein